MDNGHASSTPLESKHYRHGVGWPVSTHVLLQNLTTIILLATALSSPFRASAVGRIAYVHMGHIWLASEDGKHLVQLTRGGLDRSPAWSPDGKYIAFIRTSSATGSHSGYIVAANGGRIRKVTGRADCTAIGWSKTSNYPLFITSRPGPQSSGGTITELHRTTAHGAAGLAIDLSSALQGVDMTITNFDSIVSGEQAFLLGVRGHLVDAVIMLTLNHGGHPTAESFPSISPPGQPKMVPVYCACSPTNSNLFACLVRVEFADTEHPYWACFCLTDANGKYMREFADPESASRSRILPNRDHANFLAGVKPRISWSPDGHRIVYEREHAVWIADLQTKQCQLIAVGEAPDWSP